MQLTEKQLQDTREILMTSDIREVARFMMRLQFGQPTDDMRDARTAVERLGWVSPGTASLTEAGWFAADSCREYVFWIERGRMLPFAAEAPELVSEGLAGKSVLEIGSGSGMNLLSLARCATEVAGLEPVGLYRQIGMLFAEAEGLTSIRTEPGRAEALPFGDASFDTVLCVSAHQYFDILPALREIARVLRPGGEAILIGGTLGPYVVGGVRDIALKSVTGAKNYVVTVANTLGYMTIGKRVLVRPSKWSTAYPIYPSRSAMIGLLSDAGLFLHRPLRQAGPETVFRTRRPA
jgi:SAM-dependent methyltransferase